MSQKELQRVAVISSCVKGDLACARAASLLDLTPRHVKRLKSRLRQGGEAALAHASRGDDHWTVEEQLAGRREPTQFGRALEQLGVTYIAAQSPQAKGRIERLWGTFQDRLTSELRLAGAADLAAANQVLRRFLPDHNRRFVAHRAMRKRLGVPLLKTWIASAAFITNAASATTMSCSGTDAASRSRPSRTASALLEPEFNSSNHSKERSPSITAITSSTILRG